MISLTGTRPTQHSGTAARRPLLDTARLRLLLVAPSLPFSANWGFARRVNAFAQGLSRRHDVTLLAYGVADQSRHHDREGGLTVRCVAPPEPRSGKRRAQAASLISTRPYHMTAHRTARMQAELDLLLATQEFDLVQVESVQMMGLRVDGACPVVLDEHNVESELLRQVARTERSTSRRVFAAIEAAKLRRQELRSWAAVDGCVLTSAIDEAMVRALAPEVATRVVPNGVDLQAFRPRPGGVENDSIVFVGAINYRPNTDAVLFFVREVLPRIRRVRPSAVFTVVGGGAPRTVARLAADDVRLTGPVTDIRPHLARAGVIVAPLRAGGGTRLKVLEALAMGKAVVSTSVGCEGLAVRDLEHLMIADEPEAFAERVLRLMAHSDLRARLGRAGHTLVEREYGWEHALERLEQFHAELTRNPVGTRR